MKNCHLGFTVALIAMTWLLAGTLDAQTLIYNNLAGSSSDPVKNWSGALKLGQSFTAGASGTISSLTLNLTTSNSSATPVYSVELWSDN